MVMKTVPQQSFQSTNFNSSNQSDLVTGPFQELIDYTRDYIKANPESAALWCFGIGFVLGWKLKPW